MLGVSRCKMRHLQAKVGHLQTILGGSNSGSDAGGSTGGSNSGSGAGGDDEPPVYE